MDIEYTFPGSVEISLDEADLASVRSQGFCMDRNGFQSIEGKTWIRTDESTRKMGRATIDGDGDLNVWLSRDSQSPTVIGRTNIQSGNNVRGDDDIVEHYLGSDGNIVVRW